MATRPNRARRYCIVGQDVICDCVYFNRLRDLRNRMSSQRLLIAGKISRALSSEFSKQYWDSLTPVLKRITSPPPISLMSLSCPFNPTSLYFHGIPHSLSDCASRVLLSPNTESRLLGVSFPANSPSISKSLRLLHTAHPARMDCGSRQRKYVVYKIKLNIKRLSSSI